MTEAILTCRVCGSEFVIPRDALLQACPACGTTHSRPRSSGTALSALRRAHALRASCDFANAERTYQHVLLDAPDEHEALWGLVLCRYGVEYVAAERTGERRATVHFVQRRPVTLDPDFRQACTFAPDDVRALYEKEAAYIQRIQQGVWAAGDACPACDVFLCYKATDPDAPGEHAREFEHARELYFHLIADGYRVFFAHESLQHVSGADYEAQIYHALHSARAMLLICSVPAHLTTPWVQSEWSRFLARADEEKGCRLIPLLYDGFAPSSLPAPIMARRIEGLRMGELTSYNRLCSSLTAVIGQAPARPSSAAPAKNAPAARRPWRAALALVIVLAGLAGAWFAWNAAQTDGVRTPEASPTAAAAPTEEPVTAEVVTSEAVEEPVVEEPVVEEPAVEEAVAEEAVAEEAVAEEAVVEEPVVEEPVVTEPAVEEPPVEAVAEEVVTEESIEPAILTVVAPGFDDQPVTVTLTLDATGAIAALTVDASSQAPVFADLCTAPDWLDQFIGKKGPFIAGVDGVDAITGATWTSSAVINAINSLYPQTASASGFGGQPVTVTLTLDAAGAIASLSVNAASQTPGIGDRCGSEAWLSQFIGKKGPFIAGVDGVDTITGATITSTAVIDAINSLLPAVH